MLQDIAPHIYHNQMSWKEPEADDFVLCYRGRTLYCKVEDGSLVLPRGKDVAASSLQYAFSIDERADYLLSDAELKEANGFSYFDTGKLRTLVPGPALMAAAAGESLYRWYSGQRFCGRCGKPMEKSRIERAMVCPACGNTELDGSDKITVQEDELSEAGWFYRSEIPEDRTHLSLTGEMMEQFRKGLA